MKTTTRIRRTAIVLAALGTLSTTLPGFAADSAASLGKQTFDTYCVGCHQPNGVGKPGVAPSLTSPEFLSSATDEFLHTTIANGRPGTAMVGWKAILGEKKIDAVIAYLRSFAKGPSKVQQVNSEPPAKGDISLGKARFAEICKGCHAEKGAGYAAGGSAPAIGKPGFLNVASDGYIREMVMHGRSNTRMRGFSGSTGLANLSKKEIDSIISYLRTLNH